MSMLSKQDHSRSRVAASTHEISGLYSLLVRVVGYKVDKLLNLRLGKKTKGHHVEYHQMGRVRVDKKIFGAPRWYPSPMLIKDRVVLGPVEQTLNCTDICRIYGVP
jgi:hypothetical protein